MNTPRSPFTLFIALIAIFTSTACMVPVAADHHDDDARVATPEKEEKHKAEPGDDDAEASKGGEKHAEKPNGKSVIRDQSVTHHSVTIGGKEIKYTATAAKMVLLDAKGKDRAAVFFTAYTRDDAGDLSKRPITFAFNGGPGSASLWLHLGVLGPRRIKFDDMGQTDGPPYDIIDNDLSMLDISDIVMVDPVSTGFSRAAEGQKPDQFHGYQEDIQSVGEFIWSYTTHNKRWKSPKFLLGESYGTTRAAGLSGHLQDRYGMYLNGLVLVSVVLDFQTLRFGEGNDLPYVLFLPGYTATAWYHKQLDNNLQKDLAKTVAEARKFAQEEYMPALFKGTALSDKERKEVIKKLAKYTGLSEEYIDHADLRISMGAFAKELMRDENRTVGRFDGRYTGIDRVRTGTHTDYDPSKTALFGPFASSINQYLRDELQFESNLKYDVFGRIGRWNYEQFTGRYVNVSETLRTAMTENPKLKVFCANGYYDLATPFFATEYTFNHLGLDSSLQDNVEMGYYEAGHMMYVHKPSLEKFKADMVKFYSDTLKK